MCQPLPATQLPKQVLWLSQVHYLALHMPNRRLQSRKCSPRQILFQMLILNSDRYAHLAESGFQVTNCTQSDLTAHLVERCGGHFVDIGTGVELLCTKKVGIKSGVSPVSYTSSGLRFSDASKLDADAIVWCTGFNGTDLRHNLSDILGEGAEVIQDRMDSTWGVDAEGEIRGLWKRHAKVENFWVFAGGTHQHRWYSKVIALQIKGALEGILPRPYLEVPRASQ